MTDTPANPFASMLAEHADHTWAQVGPCVYCEPCNLRLYQGDLPASKRTVLVCPDGQHDWDEEMGMGFYFLCKRCGFKEWAE